MRNNEPWFIATEAAKKLGYVNSRDAIYKHTKPTDRMLLTSRIATLEKLDIKVPNRGLTLITEIGLYKLCFRSNLPEADVFVDWVANVIRDIRKHGFYQLPALKSWKTLTPGERAVYENTAISMLSNDYDDAREILRYAFFGSDVAASNDTITIDVFAKVISDTYDIGQNRLYKALRDAGYLVSDRLSASRWNAPKQSELKAGRMAVAVIVTNKSTYKRTLVTMKGFKYYLEKLSMILSPVDQKRKRISIIDDPNVLDELVRKYYPDMFASSRDSEGFYQLKPTPIYHLRLNGLRDGHYFFGADDQPRN